MERYVALGDSYTIGEGVEPEERWPNQLVAYLLETGVDIDLVANPSVTGWTTADVLEKELPVLRESDATFVTLLIGVNDWVQGIDAELFRERLGRIIGAVQQELPSPDRLLLVTIPDFSVTPEGEKYSRGRNITAGISAFNATIIESARQRDLAVADIFDLSRELVGPEWVAADGLHPSGAAYRRWLERIAPLAVRILQKG